MRSEAMVHLRRGRAAFAVGRYPEALREASLAIAHDAVNLFAHGLLAETLFNLGRHRECVAAADRGLAVGSDEHLHRLRALSLLALRRRKAALSSARAALRLAPELAESHWAMANVLMGMRRFGEAQRHAEKSVELSPDRWESHAARERFCGAATA